MSLFGKFFGSKRAQDKASEPSLPPRLAPIHPTSSPAEMSAYPPGARIAGRYEVASRPLMGGMGLVYLCFDHEEQRPVALKTFRPEFLPDRAARDRFLREGTAWVNLGAHPHIVRCYQVVRIGDGTEVYLALELVAKEESRADASLRSWLTPGCPLPADMALLFALQVAWGMAHAAECLPGFVHRDLKPENLLVGADRLSGEAAAHRLRITDLGLATVLEAAGQRPEAGGKAHATEDTLRHTHLTRGIVGTPLYMAPEQWRGEPLTTATDIYALGCILYEMVAGHPAVAGRSTAALRQAHCAGEVQPLPRGMTEAVREVVSHCLALDPGGRYPTWPSLEAVLAAAYRQIAGRFVPDPEPAAALDRADRVAAGWSYSAMGASYLDLGKAEVARRYFERARAAGAAEGERRLEGAGLCNLGSVYVSLGDARQAIGCYEQALAIDREIGDRSSEWNAQCNLGSAYANLGDARRAIGCYEQSLAIAREIGDRRGEGHSLGNLGLAYADLGDARRAIGYYEQALTIHHEIGDQRGAGHNLGNLGLAYADLGDARQAISYHERALTIAREIGDRRGEGDDLGNLGIAYKDLGDARRAINYLEQCLAIAREIGDRRSEGAALGNLGTAYDALGDARRAVEYWQCAIVILDEIGDVMNAVTIDFNLAALLAQQGRFAEALSHAERATQVFAQIGHTQYAQRAQQLLVGIQAALRQQSE